MADIKLTIDDAVLGVVNDAVTNQFPVEWAQFQKAHAGATAGDFVAWKSVQFLLGVVKQRKAQTDKDAANALLAGLIGKVQINGSPIKPAGPSNNNGTP